MAKLRGELKELPSSCGGSLAVSLTVRRSAKVAHSHSPTKQNHGTSGRCGHLNDTGPSFTEPPSTNVVSQVWDTEGRKAALLGSFRSHLTLSSITLRK